MTSDPFIILLHKTILLLRENIIKIILLYHVKGIFVNGYTKILKFYSYIPPDHSKRHLLKAILKRELSEMPV